MVMVSMVGDRKVQEMEEMMTRGNSTLTHGLDDGRALVQRRRHKDSPQRAFAAVHCDVEDWDGIGVQ